MIDLSWQEPQTSSVTQVDSNQAYEPMAVNKPAPMQAQGSHYQNAPIKGIHQGPPTKKKIPPIPMHPKKRYIALAFSNKLKL